jgi:SpoVK/Ycf46/Vps4 family AAA+-type ATPase
MARALAQSCSSHGKPVAFFVRKGADVLNKWVGESERQLRLLFEQAKGILFSFSLAAFHYLFR